MAQGIHGARSIRRTTAGCCSRAASATLITARAMPQASESRNAGSVNSSGMTLTGPIPGRVGPAWNECAFHTTLKRKIAPSAPSSLTRNARGERNGTFRRTHAQTGSIA